MQQIENLSYEKHVFVCVNERPEGKACCKNVYGHEIFMELKDFVIKNGLAGKVWVTKTGCLGFCNDVGCTIVVYPDRMWFMQATKEDLGRVKEFIYKKSL
jgi:(2Fe-2S) ferredoxin